MKPESHEGRAAGSCIEVLLTVIRDIKVEIAVAVEVEEHRPRAEPWIVHPCLKGHVAKGVSSFLPVVTVKNIGAVLADIKVKVSIAVVIANGASSSKTSAWDSLLLGHIGERVLPVVSVESVGNASIPLRCGRERPAIDEVNVQVAILVVVEEESARGQGFHNVVLAGAAVGVPELDPRGVAALFELNAGGWAGHERGRSIPGAARSPIASCQESSQHDSQE